MEVYVETDPVKKCTTKQFRSIWSWYALPAPVSQAHIYLISTVINENC